jgi:hypothetical protein
MFLDIQAGLGPMYMRTEEAMEKLAGGDPARMEKVREEAWEDFLDMTISQALTWAAQNIAPEVKPSEVVLAEPYIMGSHSGEAGGWRPNLQYAMCWTIQKRQPRTRALWSGSSAPSGHPWISLSSTGVSPLPRR